MKKAQEQAHDLLRRAAFTAPPRLRHEIRQLLKDPGVGDEDIELRDYVPRVELQGTESARRILEDRVVALEAANRALRVERDEARADMHTAQDMIEKVRAEYSDEIVAVAGERNRALAQVGALREHLFALEPHDVLCGYTKDTRIGRLYRSIPPVSAAYVTTVPFVAMKTDRRATFPASIPQQFFMYRACRDEHETPRKSIISCCRKTPGTVGLTKRSMSPMI